VSGSSLDTPGGLCSDGASLYVADSGNHRVLVWSSFDVSGRTAAFAIGQPDLTTNTAGVGPSRLSDPRLASCDGGRLLVADRGNQRVLLWAAVPQGAGSAASLALGQPDLDTAGAPAAGDRAFNGPAAAALASPAGALAVADTGNNRVLLWPSAPTSSGIAATLVLGQGDFAATSPDRGGSPGPTSYDAPAGLLFRGGALAVSDRGNSRVLLYSAVPAASAAAADAVLGQPNLGASEPNRGGAPAADALNQPTALCAVADGIAVVDTGNHRVLIFRPWPSSTAGVAPEPAAAVVLGQPDATSGAPGPTGPATLRGPTGCAALGSALFVADTGNHRVLRFSP
jgi:hypothetical protein